MSDTSEKNSTQIDGFNHLKFIRIFDPIHIPKYLVEQIKDRDYEVDRFYEYQKKYCLVHGEDGSRLNPCNLLYLIVDDRNIGVGFLWCVVNSLANDLVIQTFSMDKKYWCQGKAVKLVETKCREIKKSCQLNKVFWVTRYPKHSEKYGFKRSKGVLMEYTGEVKEEKDGSDFIRGDQSRGICSEVHPSGTTKAESDDRAELSPAPTSSGRKAGRPRKSRSSATVRGPVSESSSSEL